MAINLPVYKQRRLVLTRFKRAVTGDPDSDKPDIDDRGWTGQFGPVVGVTSGTTVTVQLRRERIDTSAALFATSSDTSVFTVSSPAGGALPAGARADLGLTGGTGGNPKVAKLQIRFASATGPILHTMDVWVYSKVTVNLTPHRVTIGSAANPAGIPTAVAIATIIDKVKAIWKPCGVDFNVQPTMPDYHLFATAGVAKTRFNDAAGTHWSPEVAQMLAMFFVPNTINAYFVNQLATDDSANVLGHGISRARSSGSGGALPQPGILLGDQTSTGINRSGDVMWVANDLAHEIGHFFGLDHPAMSSGAVRQDTWGRRMLMFNFNLMGKLGGAGGWKDTAVGYGADASGNPRRGCLVTLKNLSQVSTDGESTTARTTITSAAGPY
jgi:hypothetical protein